MLHRKPPSRAVVEANRLFKPVQPKASEYSELQKAFHDNRERLRSERLARSSADDNETSREDSSS